MRPAKLLVKGQTSMVGYLRQEKTEKKMALVKMHRQIIFGKENPEVLQRQVEELEKEIAVIQKKLDDKQNKLSEADRKLEKLREEMIAIQARTEELREEAYKYSDTIRKDADTILK